MRSRGRVLVIALGGTIAMQTLRPGHGALPALDGRALLAPAHVVDDLPQLDILDLGARPSAALTFDDLRAVAGAIVDAAAREISGVVITQGTDTLEETAFALHAMLDVSIPVILTGAMRRPDEPSPDGVGNLIDAIRVASSSATCHCGVLVAFNGEIHAAPYVHKMSSQRTCAFSSGPRGPIGGIFEGAVRIYSPSPRPPRAVILGPQTSIVPVFQIGFEFESEIVDVLDRHSPDGVVLAALGGGHVCPPAVARLEKLATRCPVVFASRSCRDGTLSRSYGYSGGEIDLQARGLIPAGQLDAGKARMLLKLLLSTSSSRQDIESTFRLYSS